MTDEQCEAIYSALDSFGYSVDNYEFGLPRLNNPEIREKAFKILRSALASAPVAGEAYQGDSVAERLDNMADDQPPGSQAQSDLYAAATIWRKHIAHRAAPQASEEG